LTLTAEKIRGTGKSNRDEIFDMDYGYTSVVWRRSEEMRKCIATVNQLSSIEQAGDVSR
jgi:hypothetical protein